MRKIGEAVCFGLAAVLAWFLLSGFITWDMEFDLSKWTNIGRYGVVVAFMAGVFFAYRPRY